MLNRLFVLLSATLLALSSVSAGIAAGLPDGKGTDFWLTFPANYQTQTLNLFITGETATTGTVVVEGLVFSEEFSVTPGQVTTVVLPGAVHMTSSDVVEFKGIHVTASEEVSIYGLNRVNATTDAYMGLPTDVLGTEYIVMSYATSIASYGSMFTVVGTETDTEVTIVPTETAGARVLGAAYTITLQAGEVYQLESTAFESDLTGTLITSTKPVAVYGSVECVNIPSNMYGACDHIVEQLPPTETWGTNFVTMPLATRLNGDTFRFLAAQDDTIVKVNGVEVAILSRGEFYQQSIEGGAEIVADKPILVAQFSNSTNYDGVTSDPFMMLIPPHEQFQASYTLTTPAEGFAINYLNIVAPQAAIGTIEMDGEIIAGDQFSQIGTTDFYGTQVPVELGAHNFTSSFPFGAFMYGFASADSYGYPGGGSYAPVASVANITVTTVAGEGANNCTRATLTDTSAAPVEGVRVDFTVSGANSLSSFYNTDAEGKATYCYVPENAGDDVVTASVGGLSSATDPVTVDPTSTNSAPTIGGSPATEVLQGAAYSFTPTASDADGDTLTFAITNQPAWLIFDPASGALSGTPAAADIGTSAEITLTVSDGSVLAALAPFTIVVVADNDSDGISDALDSDDDNDGVNDSDDAFPFNPTESIDTDNDGTGNNADSDDDNDGIADARDQAPLDPTLSGDYDHDGIQDHEDDDIDNDGVGNDEDALDYDAEESADSDGDGVGDNADLFPESANTVEEGLSLPPQDGELGAEDLPGLARDDEQDERSNLDQDTGNPKADVEYSFQVVVKDPLAETVQLVLNGVAYDMLLVRGDSESGALYRFSTELGPAPQWQFHFEALDASGEVVERMPAGDAELDGPQVELLNGMNLLSVPKQALPEDNLQGDEIFGGSQVFAWNSGGLTAAENLGDYQAPESVVRGQGYFVVRGLNARLPELATLPENTDPQVEIALQPGWNLISNPFGGNVDLLDVQVRQDEHLTFDWSDAARLRWVVNALYSFNGEDWGSTYSMHSPGLFSSVEMIPWVSYWLYVNAQPDHDYTLIVPNPQQD